MTKHVIKRTSINKVNDFINNLMKKFYSSYSNKNYTHSNKIFLNTKLRRIYNT